MKLKYKILIRRTITIGILILSIVILSLLKTNIYISQTVFSKGISRAYIFLISNITSFFNFSLFEIILIALFIALAILLYKWGKLLRKKRKSLFLKSLLNTLIVTLCLALIYTSTASFSYYRTELPVPQYKGEIFDNEQTEALIRFYLQEFQQVSDQVERNSDGSVKLPYSHKELAAIFVEEYNRIGTFDGYLMAYTPKVKEINASMIMNYMQTSGIAITPTGEANINKYTPANWKLITIAHELAHLKGVMVENDANLLAYYLTLTSSNIYLRYAGLMYTTGRLLELAYFCFDDELAKELYKLYPEQAIIDRNLEYKFWDNYQTNFEKISDFFNDLYLKLSGVDNGINNYIDTSHHKQQISPETGEIEHILIEYSPVQKLFIEMYLSNQ